MSADTADAIGGAGAAQQEGASAWHAAGTPARAIDPDASSQGAHLAAGAKQYNANEAAAPGYAAQAAVAEPNPAESPWAKAFAFIRQTHNPMLGAGANDLHPEDEVGGGSLQPLSAPVASAQSNDPLASDGFLKIYFGHA